MALASFAWMVPLLFWSPGNALEAGGFILVLSLAASLVRAGEGWQLDFLRPAAIGLVQLALLVARIDLGLPAWGLFGDGDSTDAAARMARLENQKSVLDYVTGSLSRLQGSVGAADKRKLDEYLEAVRDVERTAAAWRLRLAALG